MMMIFSVALSSELSCFAIFWSRTSSSLVLCLAIDTEASSKKLRYRFTSFDLRCWSRKRRTLARSLSVTSWSLATIARIRKMPLISCSFISAG